MTRKRGTWGIAAVVVLAVVCGPSFARAFLPSAVEYTIKSWFSAAGRLVGLQLFESTNAPIVSETDACRLYVDATTDSLMASCNAGAYTYLVGGAATACAEDASGNITCNTFTSLNQDPTSANAIRVRQNTVTRTCANNGVAGQLTLLDKADALNQWCWCNGSVELSCLPTPVPTATLTPTPTPTLTPTPTVTATP
jgi:hypothetical protein